MRWKANVCCLSDVASVETISRFEILKSMDCNVRCITDYESLAEVVQENEPDFFCFYINKATAETLSLFSSAKRDYPSIPALLVTQLHSEALAVWALRARVWDYFSEPVDQKEFMQTVQALIDLKHSRINDEPRTAVQRNSSLPEDILTAETHKEKAVRKAIAYIHTNYPEKILQPELASSLGMSAAYFSQSFHQITGKSFSEYLMKVRIMSAVKLLGNHTMPVSTVCYEVGFSDHSYFSKTFRRMTGVSPMDYKNHKRKLPEFEVDRIEGTLK